MPVSDSFESIRRQEAAALAKAQRRHDLVMSVLAALPTSVDGLQSVHDFGYCADGTVRYTGDASLPTLLEHLPPEPLVDVEQAHQRTQKPRGYLRGQDLAGAVHVRELYPVVLRYERAPAPGGTSRGTARWWVRRGDLMLCIERSATAVEELRAMMADACYTPLLHQHSTGCVQAYARRLAEPARDVDPLQTWCDAWEAWGMARGLRAGAVALLRAVRAQTLRLGDVPSAVDHILDTAGRVKQPWARLVDSLDGAVTRQTLTELLAFAQQMRDGLPNTLQRHAQRVERVRAWLERFFAAHGVGDARAPLRRLWALELLNWCVSNETRTRVRLSRLELRGGRAYVSARVGLDVPELADEHCSFDWSFAGPTDREPDWLALPVRYA